MAARAMWKAELALGDDVLPVKLYAAAEDRGVHFRLLHARDRTPVRQQLVDPRSGEEVPRDAVRRGLEVEEGVFVVLTDEELASLEPPASRRIEVTRFVPSAALDPGWYRRPYLLGPDGDDDGYFALARALEASGRLGIARWVMRKQRYAGALAPRGRHLALIALHDARDVVAADALAPAGGASVGAGERRLAEQLISALDARFEPEALRDEYRDRVCALVEARAAGRAFTMPEEEAPAPRADLADALRESVRAAKERRVA